EIPGVTVEANYQLTVEDAAAVAEHDAVVFADAATDADGPFYFREIAPGRTGSFSSHSVTPAAVLALAHDLFDARTRGFVLGIRGHCFNEFGEVLSDGARADLSEAVRFILPLLRGKLFDQAPAEIAQEGGPCKEEEKCKTANA
ncbi:hypothetical protein LCGC14_2016470, partial [marine sediment metagenome]